MAERAQPERAQPVLGEHELSALPEGATQCSEDAEVEDQPTTLASGRLGQMWGKCASTVYRLQHICQKTCVLIGDLKVKLDITNSVVAWTDGACVFIGIGENRNRSFTLPGREQTNNRAELLAAITAMRLQDKNFEIRTDSEYVVRIGTGLLQGGIQKSGDGNADLWNEFVLGCQTICQCWQGQERRAHTQASFPHASSKLVTTSKQSHSFTRLGFVRRRLHTLDEELSPCFPKCGRDAVEDILAQHSAEGLRDFTQILNHSFDELFQPLCPSSGIPPWLPCSTCMVCARERVCVCVVVLGFVVS